MTDRIALTLSDKRIYAQHARPSDSQLPYAENVVIAIDLFRRGQQRVQIDYDLTTAREIKESLRSYGIIL